MDNLILLKKWIILDVNDKTNYEFINVIDKDNAKEITDEHNYKYVILPNGITEMIGSWFCENIKLKGVGLPRTLKRIGDDEDEEPFFMNNNLKKISFPNSLEYLYGFSYEEDDVGLEQIELPTSLKFLNIGCVNIKDIYLHDGLEEFSLSDCNKLKEIVIPGSVKILRGMTIIGAENIERIVISPGVREICSFAFSGCDNLKELHIPNSIRKISKKIISGDKKVLDKLIVPRWLKNHDFGCKVKKITTF